MKIFAIDYGRKKFGLAIGDAETKLAEPLSVIRFESIDNGIEKIGKLSEFINADVVLLGVSENAMGKETKAFGKKISKKYGKKVLFQDETLTTQDAQNLSIRAGIGRKKRRDMEDAYAAALILQSFFDGQV